MAEADSSFLINPLEKIVPKRYLTELNNDFWIGNKLGQGGNGIVFEGIRKSDSQPVALKYLSKGRVYQWGASGTRLIPLEAEIHENIGEIEGVTTYYGTYDLHHGYVMASERPAMVTDLFDYVNLFGPMDEDSARGVFKQLLSTLLDLYNVGIVHRDVKESNLIMSLVSGQVFLIDYGSATYDTAKGFTDRVGTKGYEPPEATLKKEYHALEATVWSLGVTLYSILHADMPYPTSSVHIGKPSLRFGAQISTDCRDLIKSCLRLVPERRIHLYDISQHPWCQQKKTE